MTLRLLIYNLHIVSFDFKDLPGFQAKSPALLQKQNPAEHKSQEKKIERGGHWQPFQASNRRPFRFRTHLSNSGIMRGPRANSSNFGGPWTNSSSLSELFLSCFKDKISGKLHRTPRLDELQRDKLKRVKHINAHINIESHRSIMHLGHILIIYDITRYVVTSFSLAQTEHLRRCVTPQKPRAGCHPCGQSAI